MAGCRGWLGGLCPGRAAYALPVRIDHVIIAASDLDATTDRVCAQLGLEARGGGRHDGLGTHNRIVPLRSGFLEILAVIDACEGRQSKLGRAVLRRLAEVGEGLMAWAVAVDDVTPVAARLGTSIDVVGRQGRSAKLTGLTEALTIPSLPFFISRDHEIPRSDAVPDAVFEWIEVTGDPAQLERHLDGATLPVRVSPGPAALNAVGVGELTLR